MSDVDQALYAAILALAARAANNESMLGQGAPSMLQVAQVPELRQDSTLCVYGKRREGTASRLLLAATKKVRDTVFYSKPTVRSVIALCIIEMLVLGEHKHYYVVMSSEISVLTRL